MYGSFHNRLMERALQPEPEVGMACTILMWSDRHPATVIAVSPSKHQIKVQEDAAKRIDDNGLSEVQSYTFERDPAARVETFTRRKDGSYRAKGRTTGLLLGTRQKYHDFTF